MPKHTTFDNYTHKGSIPSVTPRSCSNFTQLYRTPNGTTFTPTTFFVSALISRKLQKTIIFWVHNNLNISRLQWWILVIFSLLYLDKICASFLFSKFFPMTFGSCFFQSRSLIKKLCKIKLLYEKLYTLRYINIRKFQNVAIKFAKKIANL